MTTQLNDSQGPAADVRSFLERIDVLLQQNHTKRALNLIEESRLRSPWLVNASAVCLLRLGKVDQAVQQLRGLVVRGGVVEKSSGPTVFRINFATALLLADNLPGCLTTLAEIKDELHPLVQQLRSAIAEWKQSLPFWQRLNLALGGQPDQRIVIHRPGHLLDCEPASPKSSS